MDGWSILAPFFTITWSMLLLLFLGSTVVSLCSNLSYRYDCTNVVDAGKSCRLQGGKLSGNYLLGSLMCEDNRGTPRFGIHTHTEPFFKYIFATYTVLTMINRSMSTHSVWEEKVPSNLDLSSSFSWFFYVWISVARAAIVLRYSKNASAPWETSSQISCIKYKNKKYLGNYFSSVKHAFIKLWL